MRRLPVHHHGFRGYLFLDNLRVPRSGLTAAGSTPATLAIICNHSCVFLPIPGGGAESTPPALNGHDSRCARAIACVTYLSPCLLWPGHLHGGRGHGAHSVIVVHGTSPSRGQAHGSSLPPWVRHAASLPPWVRHAACLPPWVRHAASLPPWVRRTAVCPFDSSHLSF